MINLRNTLAVLFIPFMLFSCKQIKSSNNITEKQIMEIHDAVMPKMSAIHQNKKVLKELMQKQKDNPESVKEILTVYEALHRAGEGMMDWMNQWKAPQDDAHKSAYFKQEYPKIIKVRDDINHSLKQAQEILKKYQK